MPGILTQSRRFRRNVSQGTQTDRAPIKNDGFVVMLQCNASHVACTSTKDERKNIVCTEISAGHTLSQIRSRAWPKARVSQISSRTILQYEHIDEEYHRHVHQ